MTEREMTKDDWRALYALLFSPRSIARVICTEGAAALPPELMRLLLTGVAEVDRDR